MKLRCRINRIVAVAAAACAFQMILSSCAPTGRLTRTYDMRSTVVTSSEYEKNPTFIAYGDSRPSSLIVKRLDQYRRPSWRWVVLPIPVVDLVGSLVLSGRDLLSGDPEYGERERRLMRDAIFGNARDSSATFVLHLGDIVLDGRKPKHWERFAAENRSAIGAARADSIDYFTAIGNHESTNDATGWHNFRSAFGVPATTERYETHFVIRSPDAAIFVLDSNLIMGQGGPDEGDSLHAAGIAQLEWLDREMRSRPEVQKIVCMHHPPISFAGHHGDWSSCVRLRKRRELIDLFQEHDVRLVLSSHDHLYEYSQLDYEVMDQRKTMHFIISGGGGVPLRKALSTSTHKAYSEEYCSEGYAVRLVDYKSAHHFSRVTVEPDRIHVEVVEVSMHSGLPSVIRDIDIPAMDRSDQLEGGGSGVR